MNHIQRNAREALGQFLGIAAADVALPHLSPDGRVNWIYAYNSMTTSDFMRVECAFTFVPMVRRYSWPEVARLLLRAAGLPIGTPAVVRRAGRVDAHGRMRVEPMPAFRCATPQGEPGPLNAAQFHKHLVAARRIEEETSARDAAALEARRALSAVVDDLLQSVPGDPSHASQGLDPSGAETDGSSVD